MNHNISCPHSCADCGVPVTGRFKRCPTCQRAHDLARWRESDKKRKAIRSAARQEDKEQRTRIAEPLYVELKLRQFELIYDPSGDFSTGARFNGIDLRQSGVWSPGTKFRDRKTGKVVVL